MVFKKKKVIKRPLKKRVTKKKKKTSNFLRNFIIFGFLFVILSGLIWTWAVYVKYLEDLPTVEEIARIKQSEASVIYDREWKEIYTLALDEKRTYVEYDKISKHVVDAIVSIEDKTFFTNPWFDAKGIMRAVFNKLVWRTNEIVWTSTISQQLIKNLVLSNERSYERKIKELWLSYKINKAFTKEKIMELYLNKLEYGSNAFGIEQASKTFFTKSAIDLNVLESSILASIPKGPTYYSPYNHYDRLVWYSYSYAKGTEMNSHGLPVEKTNIMKKDDYSKNLEYVKAFKTVLKNLKYKSLGEKEFILCGVNKDFYKGYVDKDWCTKLWQDGNGMLNFLNNIQIEWSTISNRPEIQNLVYEYNAWRKDNVLWRMLEENKISFDEFVTAVSDSIGFEFNKYRENIKYPHFVFYVQEYLEKEFGKELISKWGLKIYTTIDSKLQDEAEKIVAEQVAINKQRFDAKNAALISLDNKTGQILSMIWSADYFDTDIDWQVNVLTYLPNNKTRGGRQPGSSFKPFVYALAMKNSNIGSKTPIFDLETEFPSYPTPYKPKNYDGTFKGLMNVSTALNNSRNIPAVKMAYLAWGPKKVVNFVRSLWMDSLDEDRQYGASIWLGSAEVLPIDLARGYSTIASGGFKKEITPILKVEDKNGNVITKFVDTPGIKVMDENLAWLITKVMSSSETRPASWNNFLTITGRDVASKTGTSTKPDPSGKIDPRTGRVMVLPSDLWTTWFTPQITTVVWTWNNEGATNMKWNGLEASGVIWKRFMEFAHKGKSVETRPMPKWITSLTISKLSGLLTPEEYNDEFKDVSFYITGNEPKALDHSLKTVKYDTLCFGQVTDKTPANAIKTWNYIAFRTIDPTQTTWNKSMNTWIANGWAQSQFSNYSNIITKFPSETCYRAWNAVKNANIIMTSDLKDGDVLAHGNNKINISYKSYNRLNKVEVYLNNKLVHTQNIDNQKEWSFPVNIVIPDSYKGAYNLKIKGTDNILYADSTTYRVGVVGKDIVWPIIKVTNPIDWDKALYEWEFFNLRWTVQDRSSIRSINVYLDGQAVAIWLKGNSFGVAINEDRTLPLWEYTIKIEAIDIAFNKTIKNIKLKIIEK